MTSAYFIYELSRIEEPMWKLQSKIWAKEGVEIWGSTVSDPPAPFFLV